jgi:hypothetical protein
MTIKLTDIKYDLYDAETNPKDNLSNRDLDLPDELTIDQKTIDELYGDDFDFDRDIAELIGCQTGFEAKSYHCTIC